MIIETPIPVYILYHIWEEQKFFPGIEVKKWSISRTTTHMHIFFSQYCKKKYVRQIYQYIRTYEQIIF